jgi:outer membrane protein assembly factor BamD
MYIILLAVTMLCGCKSYNIKPDITPEERFELAKKMFGNRDFFDAKNQFRIVTLNSPGSPYIDEAQFYLAECHFNMKEYILAADEYERLTRFYPRSQWFDDAQYKMAFCSYKLSPRPALDSKYTTQAAQQLQRGRSAVKGMPHQVGQKGIRFRHPL